MLSQNYVFDDNYVVENKGIPLVSFNSHYVNITPPLNCTHMHYHSDFEIIYVQKGKFRMLVNEKEVIAQDGEMVLINPYETHCGDLLTSDASYYCIDFDAKLLPLSEKNVKYPSLVKGDFESYIININNAYSEGLPGWQLSALGNLMLLFSYLEDKLISADEENDNTFTKNVLNYLSENYSANISSKTAAAEFGYEQSYFCRLFKKCFSIKFSDYLNIYRIKKAKEFLKTKKVSESATLAGFSSISYFSVVFKKETGLSPMEFKKQQL